MSLRIGTRGSELALWQARHVRDELQAARAGIEVELVTVTTRGDKIVEEALHEIPGKGLFTKELEDALFRNEIDLAVHSLKDLPTELPDGLELAAILKREDPAEALLSRNGGGIEDIPPGGSVLTGSLRREAQLLNVRPDVKVLPIRGNVPTRVRKFRESGSDGLVLACAGLVRLGMQGEISRRLDPAEFQPACGQGALAVEIRRDDRSVAGLLGVLDDESTRLCVTAERAFLAGMGGGCQAPVGAFARFDAPWKMTMTAMSAAIGGSRLVRLTDTAEVRDMPAAVAFGQDLAARASRSNKP